MSTPFGSVRTGVHVLCITCSEGGGEVKNLLTPPPGADVGAPLQACKGGQVNPQGDIMSGAHVEGSCSAAVGAAV